VNPSPEQVRQALRNHRRPPRTPGKRLRDALVHVSYSRTKKPGAAQTATGPGAMSDAIDSQNSITR